MPLTVASTLSLAEAFMFSQALSDIFAMGLFGHQLEVESVRSPVFAPNVKPNTPIQQLPFIHPQFPMPYYITFLSFLPIALLL